jgi:shikimate dehydrogenase
MKKIFNKKNEFCISISKKPGMFGTIIHNVGYKSLGLNFSYKAFKTNNLQDAIKGVRALEIRGCSISMPYKEKVIEYIDELDSTAKQVKAVNTIVNNNGKLIGHNTDVLSLKKCLRKNCKNKNQKILVLGAGGMTRAVLVALNYLKMKNIMIANRTRSKGKKIAKEFDLEFIPWDNRNNIQTDIIINSTSIGMYPKISELPISENVIKNAKTVVDVVSNPIKTKLITLSLKNKKNTILGTDLAFEQAITQFKLYTGKKAPVLEMQKAINQFYKIKNK